MKLKKSQRLVLDMLRGGPVTTSQFINAGAGNRFGARIKELRDLGFVIRTENLRGGAVYRLMHDLERAQDRAALHAEATATPPVRTEPPGPAAAPAPSLFEPGTPSRLALPGFMDVDDEAA